MAELFQHNWFPRSQPYSRSTVWTNLTSAPLPWSRARVIYRAADWSGSDQGVGGSILEADCRGVTAGGDCRRWSAQRGKVIAVLDAGRGDVYAGEYRGERLEAQLESERTADPFRIDADGGWFGAWSPPITAWRRAARDGSLQVEEIEVPGSDAIARLGWHKILAGNTVSPAELDANYIRRSSELFSKGSS